jgi:hypothetical protein
MVMVVCAITEAQETPVAFQPIARIGYSFDFESANHEAGRATATPLTAPSSVLSGLEVYASQMPLPIMYIGNYGSFEDVSDAGFESVPVGNDTRQADDNDDNGYPGVFRVFSDVNGDGVIDPLETVAIINGFGDLYTYNIAFDEVSFEASRDFTSLELMKQYVLFGDASVNSATTGWRFEAYHNEWSAVIGDEVRGQWAVRPERSETIGWKPLRELVEESRVSFYSTAGLRSLWLDDSFALDAQGSLLGHAWVEQENDHYVLGPQLGLGAVAEASMFRLEFVTLGLVGYGHLESEQRNAYGEEFQPGTLNRSASAQAISNDYESSEDHVAWHGETRLTASCQITQQLRFDATWRWFVTGPVYSAGESIVWEAPDFGLHQPDDDAAYGSDWFLGLTYTR